MASFILQQKWYTEQKEDIKHENVRIVTAAAKLIRDDIRQKQ